MAESVSQWEVLTIDQADLAAVDGINWWIGVSTPVDWGQYPYYDTSPSIKKWDMPTM